MGIFKKIFGGSDEPERINSTSFEEEYTIDENGQKEVLRSVKMENGKVVEQFSHETRGNTQRTLRGWKDKRK